MKKGLDCSEVLALISFLRLPLALLVVFIHVSIPEEWCVPWEWSVINFLRFHFLCPLAVPVFFLFAGFLFFRERILTKKIYFRKIKSRVRSILVPYLFFSFVAAGYIWVTRSYGFSRVHENPYDEIHGIWDFLVFVVADGGGVAHLWFLKYLFALFLISPILYWVLDYGRVVSILACAGYLLLDGATYSSISLFFWMLGGYFALSRTWVLIPRGLLAFSFLYGSGSVIEYFIRDAKCLHGLNLIFGVLLIISLWKTFSEIGNFWIIRKIKELPDASYFIYLVHMFFVGVVTKIYGFSGGGGFGSFIIIGASVFLICFSIFLVLRKCFPLGLRLIFGKV